MIVQICGIQSEQKIKVAELVDEYFDAVYAMSGLEVQILLGDEIDKVVMLRSFIAEAKNEEDAVLSAHMLFAAEATVNYSKYFVVYFPCGKYLVDTEYAKVFSDLGIQHMVYLSQDSSEAADQIRALVEGLTSDDYTTEDEN